jgi:hypothetical protein
VLSLLTLSKDSHLSDASATHLPPRTLSFLASCLQSVFTIAPSALWFVFLSSGRLESTVDFALIFFKASQSPTPCSSIKRQVVCPPRTPRRRRHNIRPEALIAPRVINFDSLPWISALDDPVLTAGNPWDSDLSALASAEYMRVSGLGPVRRRKSISSRDRTEPLVPLVSPPPSVTSTPPPRFPSPSRVQFIGLMPIMTPAQEATW